MTTSKSPYFKLKVQADEIARNLKKASRGERIGSDPLGKIAASLEKGEVTMGIVMDDVIVKITLQWSNILENSEADLSKFIVKAMQASI